MKNSLVLFPVIALSFGLIHSAEPEASSEQLPKDWLPPRPEMR